MVNKTDFKEATVSRNDL